jgi:hypothetical protein
MTIKQTLCMFIYIYIHTKSQGFKVFAKHENSKQRQWSAGKKTNFELTAQRSLTVTLKPTSDFLPSTSLTQDILN